MAACGDAVAAAFLARGNRSTTPEAAATSVAELSAWLADGVAVLASVAGG
jgi:hypothetical protein